MPKLVILLSRDKVNLSSFSADLGARLQYKVVDILECSYKICREMSLSVLIVDNNTGPYRTDFSSLKLEQAKQETDSLRQMKNLHFCNTRLMGEKWLEVSSNLKDDNKNILLVGIYSKEELRFFVDKHSAVIIFLDVIPHYVSQAFVDNEDKRLTSLLDGYSFKSFNPETSSVKDLVFYLTKSCTK